MVWLTAEVVRVSYAPAADALEEVVNAQVDRLRELYSELADTHTLPGE
jgi:hypothetical protein